MALGASWRAWGAFLMAPRKATSGEGKPSAPRRKPGPPKGITFREVQRRAEAGVSLEDILHVLDISPDLAARHREQLEATVARGQAIYRAAIAKRLQKEGVFRGKAHSLLALARNHLHFDKPSALDQQQTLALFVTQTTEQATATILEAVRRVRRAHPWASVRHRCDLCGDHYTCPRCVPAGGELSGAPCCLEHDPRLPPKPDDDEPGPLPEPEEVGGDD